MNIYEPSALVCMSKGAALYLGTIADTEAHTHHAIQIIFGINELFDISVNHENFQVRSLAVNSDEVHRFTGKGNQQILFFVEPESAFGEIIRSKLVTQSRVLEWGEDFYSEIKKNISENKLSVTLLQELILDVWQTPLTLRRTDTRISRVLAYMERVPNKMVTIRELASQVSLSESRLQHLFKNQIGISIKRYLLWQRLLDGIKIVIAGTDFTTAAHAVGFSDSAHMSRTFKEMFGINLSKIFGNSRFIQVRIANT